MTLIFNILLLLIIIVDGYSFNFNFPDFISKKKHICNELFLKKKLFGRKLVKSSGILISFVLISQSPALAEYNENLEWIGPPEQTWMDRIEKAKTMSRRDIFMAAKGAGTE